MVGSSDVDADLVIDVASVVVVVVSCVEDASVVVDGSSVDEVASVVVERASDELVEGRTNTDVVQGRVQSLGGGTVTTGSQVPVLGHGSVIVVMTSGGGVVVRDSEGEGRTNTDVVQG